MPPGSRPVEAIDLALGHEPLDRRAELRPGGWQDLPEPQRIILMDGQGEVPVLQAPDGPTVLATVPAVPAEHSGDRQDLFLGVDTEGVAVCGRVVDRAAVELPEAVRWAGLRSVGMRLSAAERGLVAELLALANWHRTHTRCPRCGAATDVAGLGWWRTCPHDGSQHFPRTDPAIIALLVDGQDNALLGRQASWPVGAFSTIAGFVEPGESAESAVLREFAEEVGLRPGAVTYVGSQPWPFPASLMLGFSAHIDGVRPAPQVDGTEIVEARWLSRQELPAACAAGEVRLPGRLSIAHHLVRRWLGSDIPSAWCRW